MQILNSISVLLFGIFPDCLLYEIINTYIFLNFSFQKNYSVPWHQDGDGRHLEMPVVASIENPNLSHLLTRSDSLRSSAERSDGDLSSVDKRVSFNNDVKIKCIPSKKSNNNKTSSESHQSRESNKIEWCNNLGWN